MSYISNDSQGAECYVPNTISSPGKEESTLVANSSVTQYAALHLIALWQILSLIFQKSMEEKHNLCRPLIKWEKAKEMMMIMMMMMSDDWWSQSKIKTFQQIYVV